ncbi:transcription initiation factor TFIID subunit 5-like [Pollicipes pollicipes]|uniref:transcription initiation factor TFIID subunit 5-like n=1 Tax=Pollicipes pollicipes TaxID=41117 RepID=UPI0018850ABB|nr:transcription initiation factor TFIID subunit 5-like [Pollicipes pollicipes]
MSQLWRFRSSSGLGSLGSGGGELQELRVLCQETQPFSCAAFHPTRPLIATGGWDGKIKIWDTTDMQRKAVRHGHMAAVRCLAISPNADYLVSGDLAGCLIIWGTKHGDPIQKAFVHKGAVQAVCYLSGQRFVSAGADGDLAPDARITSLTCMPEGADDSHLGVAMLGRDGMVLLWTSDDGWRAPVRSLEAFSVPVSALAWLENSLLAAGQDSQLVVYADADKPDSDELTRRVITGNDAPVCSLAVAVSGVSA